MSKLSLYRINNEDFISNLLSMIVLWGKKMEICYVVINKKIKVCNNN